MTSSIIPKGNESGMIHLVGSIKYATHNQATIRTKRLTLLSHKSLINSLTRDMKVGMNLDRIAISNEIPNLFIMIFRPC
jgi:hypothetical protein